MGIYVPIWSLYNFGAISKMLQNNAEHAVQFYAAGIGGRDWGKGREFSPKLLE